MFPRTPFSRFLPDFKNLSGIRNLSSLVLNFSTESLVTISSLREFHKFIHLVGKELILNVFRQLGFCIF